MFYQVKLLNKDIFAGYSKAVFLLQLFFVGMSVIANVPFLSFFAAQLLHRYLKLVVLLNRDIFWVASFIFIFSFILV